jgi:putative FmdB family regulatory protein
MPFYEYQCKACGEHHEAMQKMGDAPLKKCPACGRTRLVRLLSAPVFRLKGGGWYETDFKSDKEGKRNLAGREETAEQHAAGDKDAKVDAAAVPAAAPKAEGDAAGGKAETGSTAATEAKNASADGAKPASAGGNGKASGAAAPRPPASRRTPRKGPKRR